MNFRCEQCRQSVFFLTNPVDTTCAVCGGELLATEQRPTCDEEHKNVFTDIIKKNKEKEERLKKDRLTHNSKVTRSYKLKKG